MAARATCRQAIQIGPYLAVAYVAFNLHRRPFNDVRVREALNLAYNREAVVQRSSSSASRRPTASCRRNVANYPGGASMPFRTMPYPAADRARPGVDAGGRLRAATIACARRYATTTNPDSRRMAAAFQAMVKPIYVDVEIVVSDVQIQYHKLDVQDFDLGAASWIADFNDPMDFLGLFRSTSGKNYGRYANPRVDALLARADAESDLRRPRPDPASGRKADSGGLRLGSHPFPRPSPTSFNPMLRAGSPISGTSTARAGSGSSRTGAEWGTGS